ncbi:MAG: rod-binding protein [Schwartzia sp.]|nr:rod-binding protein [Schwartzia sp. (in: firmicutes)]
MIDSIAGLGAGIPHAQYGRSAFETARTDAEAKHFEAALREAQQKAEAAKPAGVAQNVNANAMSLDEQKRLRDACEGFEAMFLSLMYKEMRKTVPKNELFGDDNAEEIWHSMLDTALMENAAKAGGVGLADMMYQQLSQPVLSAEAVKNLMQQKK